MKTGIIAIIVIALVALGFVIFGGHSSGNSVSTGETALNQPSTISAGNSGTSVKEFNMIAKQFEFNPSTVEVNEGDTVILHIKSIDLTHGIAIPAFGVNQELNPGEEVTVQFVADKKGTYTFFCNIYCGAGHREMTGTLVVN